MIWYFCRKFWMNWKIIIVIWLDDLISLLGLCDPSCAIPIAPWIHCWITLTDSVEVQMKYWRSSVWTSYEIILHSFVTIFWEFSTGNSIRKRNHGMRNWSNVHCSLVQDGFSTRNAWDLRIKSVRLSEFLNCSHSLLCNLSPNAIAIIICVE